MNDWHINALNSLYTDLLLNNTFVLERSADFIGLFAYRTYQYEHRKQRDYQLFIHCCLI